MTGDIARQVIDLSIRTVFASAAALFVLVAVAAYASKRHAPSKTPLFLLIVFVTLVSSFTLLGNALYLGAKSETRYPVSWQAGIEFWVCGVQLEIADPTSIFLNRTGTALLHEHDDQTIHAEGFIVNKAVDMSLGKFVQSIGGELSDARLSVPVAERIIENTIDGDFTDPTGAEKISAYVAAGNDGSKVTVEKNNTCNNKPAAIQAFVYSYNTKTKTYQQKKLTNPASYVFSQSETSPPGDCIIVEFDKSKPRTDRLCGAYGKRDRSKCHSFGVPKNKAESCDSSETFPKLTENKKQ